MDIDSPIPLTKADDFYKLLSVILKNGLTHQIMTQEEEKDHYLKKKTKSV